MRGGRATFYTWYVHSRGSTCSVCRPFRRCSRYFLVFVFCMEGVRGMGVAGACEAHGRRRSVQLSLRPAAQAARPGLPAQQGMRCRGDYGSSRRLPCSTRDNTTPRGRNIQRHFQSMESVPTSGGGSKERSFTMYLQSYHSRCFVPLKIWLGGNRPGFFSLQRMCYLARIIGYRPGGRCALRLAQSSR